MLSSLSIKVNIRLIMKTVAFVPVRGGSKSIPLKNIKLFCGKPLVYWSVSALQHTAAIDEIIVATDSRQIEQVVTSFCFSKVKMHVIRLVLRV